MSSVYKEQCEQQTPIYVDKFLRPGFMYYAGKPGIEIIPQTGALTDALRDGSKNICWCAVWNTVACRRQVRCRIMCVQ